MGVTERWRSSIITRQHRRRPEGRNIAAHLRIWFSAESVVQKWLHAVPSIVCHSDETQASQPPNRRLQLTAFGARDRAFFEAFSCSAPRGS